MNESYYPPGAANDPNAPYNQPDVDDGPAVEWATEQITGDNSELTAETFTEFLMSADESRLPLLVSPSNLLGPISTTDLTKLLLQCRDDDFTLAAVKELRARYLADDYTKRVIESNAVRSIEQADDNRKSAADEPSDRRREDLMERLRDAA